MRKHLSVWDTVNIIIGIVIGAGIFETAPLIFATVGRPWMSLGVWLLGGAISLAGALCYAELASRYPKSGGDYVYLSKAFGSWTGFFFGWAQLTVILTGSIGMMAFIFADYSSALIGDGAFANWILAALAVVGLSAINAFGVNLGKRTQNLLSIVKVLGLGLIVLAGLIAVVRTNGVVVAPRAPSGDETGGLFGSLGLALIFVLYTYGGWNDAAFVAAEMHEPRRNIPRALILGTLGVTSIYLLVNAAYLFGLGLEGAQNSKAIASDLLRWPFGGMGFSVMSVIVMISALGAVNGLIFTGSRVFSAMGADHRVFAWLSIWSPKLGSPVWSIAAQALISVGLILVVGSAAGRGVVSSIVGSFGFAQPQWQGHGGFDTLLKCTAPVFWLFFLMSGLSLFVLRWKDKNVRLQFEVPFYPFTPLVFCATCAYMLYQSVSYAGGLTLIGLGLLVSGTPLYWLSRSPRPRMVLVRGAELSEVGTN